MPIVAPIQNRIPIVDNALDFNYVKQPEKKQSERQIESLDDLFEDDLDISSKGNSNSKEEAQDKGGSQNQDNTSEIDIEDIQKELERKFDELFGSTGA